MGTLGLPVRASCERPRIVVSRTPSVMSSRRPPSDPSSARKPARPSAGAAVPSGKAKPAKDQPAKGSSTKGSSTKDKTAKKASSGRQLRAGHTKSSAAWLREHFDDPYVKKAQAEGYRSRAVYKLTEIDDRDHLLKPGMTVLDLGAAPGGWSQVVSRRLGGRGRLLATDILAMDPLPDVTFIQGDFREQEVMDALLAEMTGQQVDLVLSDMAPNISGTASVDQPRAMYLIELALDMACKVLRPGGVFLVKAFEGVGLDEYRKALRPHFTTVKARKPKASRPRSREVYLLCQGFSGSKVQPGPDA